MEEIQNYIFENKESFDSNTYNNLMGMLKKQYNNKNPKALVVIYSSLKIDDRWHRNMDGSFTGGTHSFFIEQVKGTILKETYEIFVSKQDQNLAHFYPKWEDIEKGMTIKFPLEVLVKDHQIMSYLDSLNTKTIFNDNTIYIDSIIVQANIIDIVF